MLDNICGSLKVYKIGESLSAENTMGLEESLGWKGKTLEDFPDIWDIEYEYEVGDYVKDIAGMYDGKVLKIRGVTRGKKGDGFCDEHSNWYEFYGETPWILSDSHYKEFIRPATPEEIEAYEEAKRPKYKVGDYVKLISKRGIGWNSSGEMDKYIGSVQKIACMHNSELFTIESDCWLFGCPSDIERFATEEEIEEYERKPKNIIGTTIYYYVEHNNKVGIARWWDSDRDKERWKTKNVFFEKKLAEIVALNRRGIHDSVFDIQKLP